MPSPTRRPRAAIAALVTLAAFACTPLASAAPGHPTATASAKPTIVLEHGAFADASGWNAVTAGLQKAGYTVIAPANPLRGLPQDAAQLAPALKPLPYTNADGSQGAELSIDPAQFRTVFAADLPANRTQVMAAEQRPIDAGAFGDTATAAAWHTIPTWALIAKQDKTLGADLERFEAQRAHAHTLEINSSHVAMISHPDTVTRLIQTAARAAG
jgi:hypothetical protein